MADRVNLANIEKAAKLIDPVFRNTPQFTDESLSAALGRRVLIKIETVNPVRSFKGRGADFLVRSLAPEQKIVCASAGNFGQAMAYAGGKKDIAVEVFVSEDVNPMKAERIASFGAKVTRAGADFEAAKDHARRYAVAHPECIFVEDGEDEAITEGAGTIAIELLEAGSIDTIVLPLGDGALITGVASWIKEQSPATRIVGVCASGAPAMAESWKKGSVFATASTDTIADGIAVRVPIAKAVERIQKLVDEIVLVDDTSLIEAMQLTASALGILLEPAGAAGLAAIRAHQLPGDRLATVLTGSNVHPKLLPQIVNFVKER